MHFNSIERIALALCTVSFMKKNRMFSRRPGYLSISVVTLHRPHTAKQ